MMNTIAIIPARYGSTRFPAKPLAMLCGRPVIEWVYRNVGAVVERVYVATEDERIVQAVNDFGGKAVMTSPDHTSGTSRVAEAYNIIGDCADIVLNIQGDEPLMSPDYVRTLIGCFDDADVQIATLVAPISMNSDEFVDPNRPKVVTDFNGNALFFSRSPIPYIRDKNSMEVAEALLHIGVYAYRQQVLKQLMELQPSPLENLEKLEQLRWLQAGYKIRTGRVSKPTIGIDTPHDLARAQEYMKLHPNVL